MSSSEPPLGRVIASFADYGGMLAAMRARAQERRIATGNAAVNEQLALLPDKYLQKLLGPRPVKRFGMIRLGPTLQVLGVRLVMVEDEAAIARTAALATRHGVEKRQEWAVRSTASIVFTRRHFQKIGRIGASVRNSKMTPEQRSEAARKAVMARWHKPRVIEVKDAAAKAAARAAR